MTAAGAAAVIAIIGDGLPWSAVAARYSQPQVDLDDGLGPTIVGVMPQAAALRLLGPAGLRPIASGVRRLPASVLLETTTVVRRYRSYNVIGRLSGQGSTWENVLFLGHWDHLGICRPLAPDKICNGAVDNASGIAMLIEIARGLSSGNRPARDILFLATTAEELGLLGARHFATAPPVSRSSIIAALNLDTVAIHPRGEPIAIIGGELPPLRDAIIKTAAELGRRIDRDGEADSFVQRQDGWALSGAGIPSAMIGGSFSDMARLSAFLNGPYHKPSDEATRAIMLDGAAEDTEFLIALARRLADPLRYLPPRR